MAVLFPTQFGTVLQPDKPAQLLQGFLNVMNAEDSTNGELTKAQLDSYAKKQFFAADSNSSVAAYLRGNFATIAALDGKGTSISTGDLVQLRNGLPTPTPAPEPEPDQQPIHKMLSLMLQMMRFMFGGFGGGFGFGGGYGAYR